MRLETFIPILSKGGNIPPVPTRDQVLSYNTHFMGGIIVNSPKYGTMPWWDSALSWCDYETRQIAYSEKHKVGDTHSILEVPNGLPLYNEYGQFYSPDKFGPLDWTNGETELTKDFDNLLIEILENNFYFHIAMDENVNASKRIIKLVAQRLKDLGLTKYGFSMPGYDGVFYGWDPLNIMDWAAQARAINPDILLGLEHDPGHPPLGEGGNDYLPGGRMKDFDIVLGEFVLHTATVWQLFGRMIRPFYPQPEQGEDDPHPPFYLVDSERGPRYYVGFESDNPYNWVRNNSTPESIEGIRNYFRSYGAKFTG